MPSKRSSKSSGSKKSAKHTKKASTHVEKKSKVSAEDSMKNDKAYCMQCKKSVHMKQMKVVPMKRRGGMGKRLTGKDEKGHNVGRIIA